MAKAIPHGTLSGYGYHKCRCDLCKQARSEVNRKWREANPDYGREWFKANPILGPKRPPREVRHGTTTGYTYHKCRCDDCRAAKRSSDQRHREANPDYHRKYQEENAERIAESKKRWLEANPGYRQRKWQENRERDAETNRLWREANPNYRRKHYEANREKAAEDLRRWRAAHPEQHTETARKLHSRRRARMRDAFVEDVPRLDIFERDEWECKIPGCLFPGVPVTLDVKWPDPMLASIDHVIPLARGGLHERGNLQTSHLRCNMVKQARTEGIA